MKKVLFIVIIAVASLASCKKDRTCTCTQNDDMTTTQTGGTGSNTTSSYTYLMTAAKKSDAKKACVSSSKTDVQNFPSSFGSAAYSETTVTTTSCSLK